MFPKTAFHAAAGIPSWVGFTTGPTEGAGGGGPNPTPPTPPPAPVPAPPATGPQNGPDWFPENTALTEMNPAQREAYWKHKARLHEDRSKATAAELAALKPRAEQYDALEAASRTEAEKAVAEAEKRGRDAAKAETEAAARETYGRALVAAKFEVALAGRLTPEQVTTLVSGLNVAGFLAADGMPDQARITEYVAAIPVGTPTPPAGGKTPDLGGGRTPPPPTSGIAAGRDLYAQRHPKRTT